MLSIAKPTLIFTVFISFTEHTRYHSHERIILDPLP